MGFFDAFKNYWKETGNIYAKNFGTLPSWHAGAGSEAFIFIDEIYLLFQHEY